MRMIGQLIYKFFEAIFGHDVVFPLLKWIGIIMIGAFVLGVLLNRLKKSNDNIQNNEGQDKSQ